MKKNTTTPTTGTKKIVMIQAVAEDGRRSLGMTTSAVTRTHSPNAAADHPADDEQDLLQVHAAAPPLPARRAGAPG